MVVLSNSSLVCYCIVCWLYILEVQQCDRFFFQCKMKFENLLSLPAASDVRTVHFHCQGKAVWHWLMAQLEVIRAKLVLRVHSWFPPLPLLIKIIRLAPPSWLYHPASSQPAPLNPHCHCIMHYSSALFTGQISWYLTCLHVPDHVSLSLPW